MYFPQGKEQVVITDKWEAVVDWWPLAEVGCTMSTNL